MRIVFALIALFALCSACGEKPKPPVSETPKDPATRSAADAYNRSKDAGSAANIDSIRNAIKAYHAANDRYPASLDEIKALVGSDIDLGPYTYDPQSGAIVPKSP